ncbi:MAG TPA: cation diffusion facilitator family transporter [Gemmatimonadaceae bacterium]|nr:cation diffusion facilitator family transporter [Gemmatimonadaceae bacterium]
MTQTPHRGIQSAQLGLLVNTVLALVKFVAGVLGNSYALVADAVESTSDIFSSAIVWGGLRIASREADSDFPFGYGKAESLAAAIVALMLLAASAGITIEAIREIRTPHHAPASFTLVVLVAVVLVKETLFRRVFQVGHEEGSTAVKADAWHHRSDAITSVAAFVGISIALWKGKGWESADDWAALVAALVIAINAVLLLRPAIFDLMDRSPDPEVVERVRLAALAVPDVLALEKLKVRRAGTGFYVDLHVQSDPTLSLHDAHIVSGKVKSAIRGAIPRAKGVLIHMEPFEGKRRKT